MSNLQIGLIIAGVVLVVAVIVYNHLQERRIRRNASSEPQRAADLRSARAQQRVEPTLGMRGAATAPAGGEAAVRVETARSCRPVHDARRRSSDGPARRCDLARHRRALHLRAGS